MVQNLSGTIVESSLVYKFLYHFMNYKYDGPCEKNKWLHINQSIFVQ